MTGISQTDLAHTYGTSVQVINNKIRLERWTAKDLCTVANVCGAKLAFILPDGQQIMLNNDEKTPD